MSERPRSATLGDLLDEIAGARPALEAVVFRGERLTYGELRARVDTVARALLGLGVRHGDRVAVLLPNRPEWLIAAFAAVKTGATVVAISTFSAPREIDAAEMHRLGLVLAVYPAERLLPEATALASRIAASGPLATRGAKRIVATRLYGGFGEARALSDTLRHALEWSQDVDEGMAAHREGRPPRFTGR